ncbi:MAG: FTR1 family iron permease [Candidatus Thorarchaeota archaeon]
MIIAPFVIALREGIEAALVIAIMLLYLRKSFQTDMRKFVWYGVTVAIVTSIGLALLMSQVWGIIDGPALAIFEGSVVLLAMLLLTTMILWMWRASANIALEIEDATKEHTTLKSGTGLFLLALTLVLREGVELVLFSAALVFQDDLFAIGGILLGLALAVILGIFLYHGSLKISLKTFFNTTSILLVFFAAGMLAYGIHELQEAGLLLIGPIEIWNINPPLLPDGTYPLLHEKGEIGAIAKALLGYNGNPSALEVTAYFSYLILIAIYYMKFRNHTEKSQDSDHKEIPITV